MKTSIPKNKKVLLGLSGGVDSTAAALLLQEKGFEVTGLFFDVLGNQQEERQAAQQTAAELKIPFIYQNVKTQFEEQMIRYFCDSYLKGETPNPCVLCNPTLKFPVLEAAADQIGAYWIATGHYAQVAYDNSLQRFFIERGVNTRKDQSYMLYRLNQQILSRLLLPLGTAEEKSKIRELVRKNAIHNADQKDSQEICFIKEGSYIDYIQSLGLESPKGNFVDRQGRIVGEHQGLLHYTVGQRKGLGITFGKPTFVTALDSLNNQVILGDDKDLFNRVVYANNTRFSLYEDGIGAFPSAYEGKAVLAKIRYASTPAKAILYGGSDKTIKIVFEEPQRAATPGQSVVFYEENRLLGGGFIVAEE